MEQYWKEESIIPIREYAYRQLKKMILERVFVADDRLVERQLAEELQISRTPIREALLRLEAQGFVKTVPRKGVVVNSTSTEQIIEVFTILSSLEALAAKLAAEKMDEVTKKEIDSYINRVEKAINEDEDDMSQLHIEISHVVYKAAKSPKLYQMLIDLTDYIRAFANIGYKLTGRKESSFREHIEVLKAVRNKESDMAQYLTKIHIENSKKAYLEAIIKKEIAGSKA
ncbi:GntR family transcriptional regulator [Bacillus sp. FJAT-45350]|uniref:GntR family transcriptional regulator n=1 Tax=Bacillus sp. FJAT-45350 TaxID=2011014 RepID=UPI000BB8D954|nr:GntR family transcriptional regulator [Bacillus sp. FJAT-45350]